MSQAEAYTIPKLDPPGSRVAPLGILSEFSSPPPAGNLKKPCDLERLSLTPAAFQEKKEKKRKTSRRFRWFLSWRLRQEIKRAGLVTEFKGLCQCGKKAIPAYVKDGAGKAVPTGSPGCAQVQVYDDPKARTGLAWVQKCANPLLCYVDAPVVRYKRSEELKKICEAMFKKGYRWFFETRTAPHDAKTDPIIFINSFQKAASKFVSGKNFANLNKKLGVEFQIRVLEVTDDSPASSQKSGIHFHHHCLIFYKLADAAGQPREMEAQEQEALKKFYTGHWIRSLQGVGLCPQGEIFWDEKEKNWRADDPKISAVLKHGLRIDFPRINKKIKRSLEQVTEYLIKGAAIEMTPGIFAKNGRIPDRISHFELMALALTTRPEALPRALGIWRALKGKQWLRYSPQLREMCGVAVKTDEELLKNSRSVPVYDLTNEELREVDRHKFQGDLIEAINTEAEGVEVKFEQGTQAAIAGEKPPEKETYALNFEAEILLGEIVAKHINQAVKGFSPVDGLPRDAKKPPD